MPSQDCPPDSADQSLTPEPGRRLAHELRVHQIELEAQNEELRNAKIALEESNARFVDLYDFAPVGYCTVGASGLITRANLTVATLLGVRRGTLTTQPLSRFIAAEDQNLYYQLRRGLLARTDAQALEPASCELRMVRADGSHFWALLAATVVFELTPAGGARTAGDGLAAGGGKELRFTLTDITARKLAETQLQSAKDNLQATLDASPDLVFEMDLDGRYLAYHSVRSDLLVAPAPSFLGKLVCDVMSADAAAVVMAALQEANAIGYSSGSIVELPLPERGAAWFELSAARKPTQANEMPRFVVISRDITERKQHERERQEWAERVQALSRGLVQAQEQARRRFAHELHDRTSPNLAALRINLDFIATASPQTQASQAFADSVADTRALIDDTTLSIRDICAELHPPVLDRGGLLSVVQSYADQFARRTGLLVPVECSHPEIRLAADLELALFRIVQEALTNCAKHARAKQVRVVVQLDGDPLHLAIEDDGVGFNPDPARSTGLRMGLGLINMRETAEFVGARFTLHSAPGRGTRIGIDMAAQAAGRDQQP